jgi:hypothetical protein
MADNPEVPPAVREAFEALAAPRPMRRGSLSQRHMKCNKSRCLCSQRPEARHGPYFSLTRAVAGTTRSRLLSTEQAKLARQQIDSAQQFRKQVEGYWKACEKWADSELEATQPTSPEAAEKGGSKRRSRRKSSKRSKIS